MIKETAVEHYQFTCPRCEKRWTRDYDVQHVADDQGRTWEYYSFNGLPAEAPTARGAVACPSCGAEHLDVTLAARRRAPVPQPAQDRPRRLLTDAQQARMRSVPLLPGDSVFYRDLY
jgi:predicted RNA-binding Zn-ribbon protein involved in translation (DUF1610 family)